MSGGQFLAASNQSVALQPGVSYFTIVQGTQGGYFITPVSITSPVTGHADATVDLTAPVFDFRQHWRIVAVASNKTWTTPSWAEQTKNGSLPNVRDGVYRVTHSRTKATLALRRDADWQEPQTILMNALEIEVRPVRFQGC